jgi:hypothetical protein
MQTCILYGFNDNKRVYPWPYRSSLKKATICSDERKKQLASLVGPLELAFQKNICSDTDSFSMVIVAVLKN